MPVRILDKSADRLTLFDDQADKKFGLMIASVFIALVCLFLAWEGFPEALLPGAALVAGLVIYGKRTAMTSRLVLDRQSDRVTLTVNDRNGTETWEWKLSDVDTAKVGTRLQSGSDSGVDRPSLILNDGTAVPMRPYHAAGSQSWHAVAAVKLFLGQPLDDAPVGWIPPAAFDEHFQDEMAQLYKKG